MLRSTAEIERHGHRVSFWFREQLTRVNYSPRLRRLLMPWLVAGKLVRAQWAGERFDVVEIHEPIAGPYALIARMAGHRWLAPSVVLSFGLEERAWQAERDHLRTRREVVPLRRRVLAPITIVLPARLAVRNAHAVLVPSTADRDYLLGPLSVPADRVSCCYTGVSEHLFAVHRADHDDVGVLFLGSWLDRKGVVELTQAWRRLASDLPAVRLTVAGVGDEDRVPSDVRRLLGVEVIPVIPRDELPSLLAQHDVFVLPSWFEGMPLSMLEAAAAGLPCVVSAICGNLDVFRPDDPQRDGAVLIPSSDSDALYRALAKLVTDQALRAALGIRARERAREFTWARNGEQALVAYAGAIRRSRIRGS